MRGGLSAAAVVGLLGTCAWLGGTESGGRARESIRQELRDQVYGEGEMVPEVRRDERKPGAHRPRLRTVGEDVPEALRVVFVGNSHSSHNAMTVEIAELARAAGQRPLYGALLLRNGARFQDHLQRGRVTEVLAQARWDVLVLQEQQQWASFNASQRAREMIAPARVFDLAAEGAGARTVVMATWARRDGDLHNRPDDSFAAMHARLMVGYRELRDELGATLAPVAVAWKRAHEQRPELPLWADDGMHPAPGGSYLAACVLYQVLYGKPALGIPYAGGLEATDAQFLQSVAASVHAAADAPLEP